MWDDKSRKGDTVNLQEEKRNYNTAWILTYLQIQFFKLINWNYKYPEGLLATDYYTFIFSFWGKLLFIVVIIMINHGCW